MRDSRVPIAMFEIVTASGTVTGQMFAVQIKCGKTFLQERNKWGYVYRGNLKHFNYLSNYPLAVVIVICDPESRECYWVHFQTEQTQFTGSEWKITVPFENRLSTAKNALQALVPPMVDSVSELQAYWSVNKIIVETSVIVYVIDNEEVMVSDVSRPRNFFDRLRLTKELAHACQGKVEITFFGYEDDPRELFEIEEVRKYVALLDDALPELFFFVRTEAPTSTIRLFALCLTKVWWVKMPSAPTGRMVGLNTDKVGLFLTKHFPALNEMTEWVGMPIEENKRISLAVCQCLKFDLSEKDINL